MTDTPPSDPALKDPDRMHRDPFGHFGIEIEGHDGRVREAFASLHELGAQGFDVAEAMRQLETTPTEQELREQQEAIATHWDAMQHFLGATFRGVDPDGAVAVTIDTNAMVGDIEFLDPSLRYSGETLTNAVVQAFAVAEAQLTEASRQLPGSTPGLA